MPGFGFGFGYWKKAKKGGGAGWIPAPLEQWLFAGEPKFEEKDGELNIKDDTGKYYPPLGEPLQKGVFVGNDSAYITLANVIQLNKVNDYWIEMVIKTNTIPAGIIEHVFSATTGASRCAIWDDGKLSLYIDNGTGYEWPAGSIPLDNAWHTILLNNTNSGVVELFVDGVSKGTNTIAAHFDIDTIFSNDDTNPVDVFEIASFKVYEANDEESLYLDFENVNVGGTDGATIIPDRSGNGNHGTIVNGDTTVNLKRTNELTNELNLQGYNIYATDDLNMPVQPPLDPAKIYIPVGASSANPEVDAFGSVLLHKGKSQFPAKVRNAHVATADGAGYIDFGQIDEINNIGTGDFTLGFFLQNLNSNGTFQHILGKGIMGVFGGFGFKLNDANELIFETRVSSIGNNHVIGFGGDYTVDRPISIIGWRENGQLKAETSIGDNLDVTDDRDLSGDYSFRLFANESGSYVLNQGTVWAVFILNRAMTAQERADYHNYGKVPDDAIFNPTLEGFPGQTIDEVFDTKGHVGQWVDSDVTVRYSGVVNHPSAFHSLLKGWSWLIRGNSATWGIIENDINLLPTERWQIRVRVWIDFANSEYWPAILCENATNQSRLVIGASEGGFYLMDSSNNGGLFPNIPDKQWVTLLFTNDGNGNVECTDTQGNSYGTNTITSNILFQRFAIYGNGSYPLSQYHKISAMAILNLDGNDFAVWAARAGNDPKFIDIAGNHNITLTNYQDGFFSLILADENGNIPGTQLPVSNKAGRFLNGSVNETIDFNPGDIKEINDSYDAGGNTFGVNDYLQREDFDGVYFQKETLDFIEKRFLIMDSTVVTHNGEGVTHNGEIVTHEG
jgi:hypothetical protein